MQLASSRLLPTDLDTAWRALNDPEALKAAIPGCESMERTAENEYVAVMAAVLGPVKAKFRGKLKVSDVMPSESYTLHFEGQGGPAGFAKGSAKVKLTPDGNQTRLDYQATAQVGGKIVQVGQRLIDAAAAKVADDFFTAFSSNLAAASRAAQTATPPSASAHVSSPAPDPSDPASLSSLGLIMAALVALLIALPSLLR